ncbi:MAG TPA: PBP1A family penicillin-binding protein [Thermodesulfobacteriota bacterium]|nr:PBP1A family penicillin-binding protein [Thermodesulfobacteriota bacterium]
MPKKPSRRSARSSKFKTLKVLFFITAFVGAIFTIAVFYYLLLIYQLPDIRSLQDYQPPLATRILSADGASLDFLFKEKRILVAPTELPPHLIQAFIASEDSRFFQHGGLDFLSILRAVWKNIWAGEIVQGGSTITQQVTKSLLLSPEKSFSRKIKEAFLAYRLDQNLSKRDILFIYLNQIYLGHGAYGVEAAAQTYFGKNSKELTLAESALLAGLPQAPSRYSPFLNFQRAKERQRYVLKRMVEEGYLSSWQAQTAEQLPLHFARGSDSIGAVAPHLSDMVRKFLYQNYGADFVLQAGLTVWTTIEPGIQKAAREAVENGARAVYSRHLYSKPLRQIPADKIEAYCHQLARPTANTSKKNGPLRTGIIVRIDPVGKTARVCLGREWGVFPLPRRTVEPKNISPDDESAADREGPDLFREGDVLNFRVEPGKPYLSLAEQNPVEAALICIDKTSGAIKALVGGKDYGQTEFNRATQAKRQPGSSFKPIIYAAGLDKGLTPASVLLDTPLVFGGSNPWSPQNFDRKFNGPTMLRTGLIQSRNIVSIRILQRIGVDYAIRYAQQLGITSSLYPNLSLALGSSGVSLAEMVTAFNCFNNAGNRVLPFYITKIMDRLGRVIYLHQPLSEPVMAPTTAYIMTHLLEGAVKEGTGWRLKALGRPVAGKTGTTNEFRDAWFIGLTPQVTAGVWVGQDNLAPLGAGETGAQAASPILLEFFQKALANTLVEEFPVPAGIVFQPLRGVAGNTVLEAFKAPEETLPVEGGAVSWIP